jgi:hypothetical protein
MLGHNWDVITGQARGVSRWHFKIGSVLFTAPGLVGLMAFAVWLPLRLPRLLLGLAWFTMLAMPVGLSLQGIGLSASLPSGVSQPWFLIAQGPIILAAWLTLAAHGIAVLLGQQLRGRPLEDAASAF